MHRSGTSTLAQVLYRLGLNLGDESDLIPPTSDNVDGHFENNRFVGINRHILKELGGAWGFPPSLTPGWRDKEEVRQISEQARELVSQFQGQSPWGWKDPRSSLLLPFWLDLMPSTRVVVCLRNPLEVAASLSKRGASSFLFGLNLWKVYNQALLENVPEEQYIVTHYESFFRRPQKEFRRILDFAGMYASDQLISLVRSRVIRGLRHHEYTTEDLLREDPSGETLELYKKLCEEASWTHTSNLQTNSSTA